MNEAMIAHLQEIASQRVWSDNEDAYAPKHVHNFAVDAYDEGFSVGQVRLARKLLLELGLSYTVKELNHG